MKLDRGNDPGIDSLRLPQAGSFEIGLGSGEEVAPGIEPKGDSGAPSGHISRRKLNSLCKPAGVSKMRSSTVGSKALVPKGTF